MKKVGILVFSDKIQERGTRKNTFFDAFEYLGLRHIISEIDRKKYTIDFCSEKTLNDFDFVLCSITSLYDIYNLCSCPGVLKRKSTLIIGGQGVSNVRAYKEYFDIAVFGRAEGQINDILAGESLPNVLRMKDDPNIERQYEYRQAKYLVNGENNVGCPNKCRFCFYSWTHHQFRPSSSYESAIGIAGQEDDIRNIKIGDGRHYVTAIDGVSEESRKRVAKPIKNQEIKDKIAEIYEKDMKKRVSLKIFVICGYPWESVDSHYLDELRQVFAESDKPTSRFPIFVHLLFTPFSPEPLTPMEIDQPNFDIDWRRFLLTGQLYDSASLKVFIMPYILSPYRLFERVYLNRATESESGLMKVLTNSKFRKQKSWQKMRWLSEHGYKKTFAERILRPWSYLFVPKSGGASG